MSQIINKSPINVLDEFCKRKLQTPAEYIFSSVKNTDFLCTVTAFNETKTATAKSKKKAKQLSAQSLIRHLRGLESFKFDLVFLNDSINSDDAEVSSSTTNENMHKSIAKSDSDINYVGNLLEYCIKNKLPPASFELLEYSNNSQSHLREFHMKCCVNDIERQGKGFCKKQAKKQAAMEVLNVLTGGQPQSNLDEPPQKRFKTAEALTSPNHNEVTTVPSQIALEVKNEGSDLVNQSDVEVNTNKVCVISYDEDNSDNVSDGSDNSDNEQFNYEETLIELPSDDESKQGFENESSSNDSAYDYY